MTMENSADSAQAWRLEDGKLVCGAPEAFFPFLEEKGHVISLVGGGGKTTTMRHLAEAFVRRGMKTVMMTSTKIGCPPQYCPDRKSCLARFDAGEIALCGTRLGSKLDAPDPEFLAWILDHADAVIIEADGAHRKPCKAPAAHEPVILPQSDIVIALMGLDALGKPVGEICHRAEIVMDILGCDAAHALTGEDMAEILLSERGSQKAVGGREFYAVLNKCDDGARLQAGENILRILEKHGHARALLTAGMRRSETFEHGETP